MEQLVWLKLCTTVYWEPCKLACWVSDIVALPVGEAHRMVEDWLVCKMFASEADIAGQQQWACRQAWWGRGVSRLGPAVQYHT